jgi:hypothetical protein
MLLPLIGCQSVEAWDDGREWGEPERIGGKVQAYKFNDLAMDPSGNATAVWTVVQQVDGQENVAATRYTPGMGWGAPELIEISDAGSAIFARVAMDAEGNAVVVWNQSNGVRMDIWVNRYTPAGGWRVVDAERISIQVEDTENARRPQVAMDDDGNGIAVWYQSDGQRNDIWANRYTPSDGWGQPELIEDDVDGDARWPHVALDSDGNAVAVWQQCYAECDSPDTNEWLWDVNANRYTPNQGWGRHRLITPDHMGNAIRPHIAMDDNGNGVAVWEQSDDSGRFDIWANRYDASSGWGAAERIETNDAGDALRPQVAMDPAGNAVAVWSQFDGLSDDIWANRYTPDESWGDAERIGNNAAGQATRPRIAMDALGSAVVVWTQSHGRYPSVWSNRYTPTSGWGTAEPVETYDGERIWEPQIAMDAAGNAIAFWSQRVGAFDEMWSNQLVWRAGAAPR